MRIMFQANKKLTHAPDIGSGVLERRLLSAVRFGDLHFSDQFQRLQDVGDVIQTADSGLHDGVRKDGAVNHFGGKLEVDLGRRLKLKRLL